MRRNGTPATEPVTIEVSTDSDIVLAGRLAVSLLESMEFEGLAVEEVTIVAKELASNIVNHAERGQLTIRPMQEGAAVGIEIVAEDTGPGITSVDRAVVDGVSTAGGIGGGLGTVHRLMDEVEIDPGGRDERGATVTARRWLRSPSTTDASPGVDIGGATRPMPGHDRNGDAFLIEHGTGESLAGVIDGLGHGAEAHRASSTAERYVRTHADESMDDLFAGVETACRSTRGVVMSLARFDLASRTVEVGSVGNVGIRFCHGATSERPISRRGVLGQGAGSPRVRTVDWRSQSVLVLYSDGISSGWECEALDLRSAETASGVASELLGDLAKPDDDATVIVAREAGG